MGNYLGLENDDDEDSGEDSIYDVRKIYWDRDGNLRYGMLLGLFVCFCKTKSSF